ncbi:MAG: methyltransferase domain-containing protein [Oscillospiraceae bacterium]|nr:methyltransferase domain-containing protein [Oscillospiraceae bacterium]
MELPMALKAEIEEKCAGHKLSLLTEAAQAISDRYRSESGQGKRLLTRDIEVLAYAAVRMPATYGAVSAALEHTFACFREPITSVLDVGAGTGAACWAVCEQLPAAPQITCLEREPAMISLGSGLMKADPRLSSAKWIRHDLTSAPTAHKADLVIASYALNELDSQNRARVLKELWDCAGKLLIIIEPGTPVGFGQLREARDTLIGLGGHVAAPCPHSKICRLPADDWCHFTCRVARSRLHKQLKGGDVPYEDEKFSFLAVSKAPVEPAPSRILRHPLKEAGKITLKLCRPEGIIEKAVTKKYGDLFKQARKASGGEPFPKF